MLLNSCYGVKKFQSRIPGLYFSLKVRQNIKAVPNGQGKSRPNNFPEIVKQSRNQEAKTMGMKKIIQIDRGDAPKEENPVSFTRFEKKKAPEATPEITEDIVYSALKDVYDPELPVSIVDLGLIYDTKISGRNVQIRMTLTTPGCSMGAHIAGQAEAAIKNAGADNVLIEVIWDPPWNPDMISDEGKKKLGIS